MIGYSCKYTPIELLAAYGAGCVRLDLAAEDFGKADALTHANLCAHARAVLEHYVKSGFREMILVNCCDSLRRIWDVIKNESRADFVFMLDLPHEHSTLGLEAFTDDLVRLAQAYGNYSGMDFDREKFFAAFTCQSEREGDFVAILGASASPELLDQARAHIDLPVADLTCGGNRRVEPPEDISDFRGLMKSYARSLLAQTPCMRMRDVSGRRELTERPHMRGAIYHTVKFCDFYAFEYENIKKVLDVPLVKIETDYTAQSAGQMATRLDAFAETLGAVPKNNRVESAKADADTKIFAGRRFVAGIDSGSTSTNMVILNELGRVAAGVIVRTGARAENGAAKALEQALRQAGLKIEDLGCIVATGYGRSGISFANRAVTEITCHARGANYTSPTARTIIDIGGQDSKVICLDREGEVKNFAMNDKCAAGTGRFLEKMALALEMDMDKFCAAGLRWRKDLTISSVCTVFAESEVVSLIAENQREEDIIHGLNKSVAVRTVALIKRVGGSGPYIMTGGVARNAGVVGAISKALGEEIFVGENPDLCGALGAALIALEDQG